MIRISPAKKVCGTIRPPSDKSLTHRSYLFGAIASGPCHVSHPLLGADCESTLRCVQQLGCTVERQSNGDVSIIPASEWHSPGSVLDCGNSGTTMRLLSGLIASRAITARLVGDESLSKRPMKRIAEPLRRMGAHFEGDQPPIRIAGSISLNAIQYDSPVASAQIKSCVLLAGLRAEGVTSVIEPNLSRDHTERMLAGCGVNIQRDGTRVSVMGGQTPNPFAFAVPADISSAAFWMVAAAVIPDSRLRLLDVGINPTRSGILDVFRSSGIAIHVSNERTEMGEPIADLELAGNEGRSAFTIEGELVPRLIDEIPVLAVLATQLEGTSVIRGAKELRVKESDRIETIANGLRAMGARVETFDDGMAIEGGQMLKGAKIDAQHDHRIGMAFAIAGLIAEGETAIEGAEIIETSYPEFWKDLEELTSE